MKTCPILRLLNQRIGNSHYHWTKKWGAGHVNCVANGYPDWPMVDHQAMYHYTQAAEQQPLLPWRTATLFGTAEQR